MHSFILSLAALSILGLNQCGGGTPAMPLQDSVYTYKTPHPDGTGKVYLGREMAHVMSAGGAD